MKDVLLIIIMYSLCLCLCLYPICMKLIDVVKQKYYNNRVKKYFENNDYDSNYIFFNNPCYNIEIDE